MFRSLSAALLLSVPAIVPLAAQVPSGSRAVLAEPPAQAAIVVREQMWRCEGATCTAAASNSRPLTVCMALARKAGPVQAFSTGGMEMGADLLSRCNAVAATVAAVPQ